MSMLREIHDGSHKSAFHFAEYFLICVPNVCISIGSIRHSTRFQYGIHLRIQYPDGQVRIRLIAEYPPPTRTP